MWNNKYKISYQNEVHPSIYMYIHGTLGQCQGIVTIFFFFFKFKQLLKVISLALQHGLFVFGSSPENNTMVLQT